MSFFAINAGLPLLGYLFPFLQQREKGNGFFGAKSL
jgi:hypothetical protein